MNQQQKKPETCPGSNHPSGLEDAELAFVSMEFWSQEFNRDSSASMPETWIKLLAFQQGWKACKDFYKVKDDQ